MPPANDGAPPAVGASVDPAELAHFSRLAGQWWDPHGPWASLHRLNPVRLRYIRDRTAAHFGREAARLDSLAGLRMLDIGCGGGVLSEPLARLGAAMVGIDPVAANVAAASHHATATGLAIDYRCTTAEAMAAAGEAFDVVLAMEVVEHVADLDAFVAACATLLRPGGLLFVATINRTLKSYALLIVAAEHILRWIPRGTHQWHKFVTPDALETALAQCGLDTVGKTGVIYNVLADRFALAADMDANYMMVAGRPW